MHLLVKFSIFSASSVFSRAASFRLANTCAEVFSASLAGGEYKQRGYGEGGGHREGGEEKGVRTEGERGRGRERGKRGGEGQERGEAGGEE